MHLLLVEFYENFAKMKSDGSNMHRIVFEGTRAKILYGNTPLNATDKFLKASHFLAGTLEKRILL
jgi:hypothetical protein